MYSRFAAHLLVLLALTSMAGLRAQEGFPLDGTWRGAWGPEADAHLVVMVMKWDGETINGRINPGPDSIPFAVATLETSDWTVHIEAESGAAGRIAIDGRLDDIGSYNRSIEGTWKQNGVEFPFRIARE